MDTAPLSWFPKQFDAGAINGEGAKKLLGTPAVSPADVLVREMAQNSWDARGDAAEIAFTMNLRKLSPAVVSVLREQVFTGAATGTGLRELLTRPEVWALEISDRGTVGLGGPIRNDLAVTPGVSTNFIDLVFNVGSTKSDPHAGGNYGFGKTISYSVSEVGAVLIWSRCRDEAEVQDRLIGSAIGEAFDRGGKRYTGRHWWGRAIDGDRVEPILGREASTVGSDVFSHGFNDGATGTSQLVLSPVLGGVDREADVDMLVKATLYNLWPKLLRDQRDRSRMNIRIQIDGAEVPVPAVETHPVLSGYADCLQAVRAAQAGWPTPTAAWKVDVHEIRSQRPIKLLGHLALTRYPLDERAADAAGIDPGRGVTMMRHEAELVVTTSLQQTLTTAGFQWAGVFKPVNEVDASFAKAEPPAHDDWLTQHIKDPRMKRDVNISFTRMKEAVDQFLAPPSAASRDVATSAAAVGDMLAGMLAGIEGPGPSTRTPEAKGGAGKRAARPRAVVESVQREHASPGWRRTTLTLTAEDLPAVGATVRVTLRVGIDGGSEEGDDVIRVVGWSDSTAGNDRTFLPGAKSHFVYESREDLAIDVDASVVNEPV
ncbi:hypothetical protein ACWZJV_18260 [Nocardioides sp. WG-D5]